VPKPQITSDNIAHRAMLDHPDGWYTAGMPCEFGPHRRK
jgi:hypothetical protein